MITEEDVKFLRRAVDLAREALEKGDSPFGSVLVSETGEVLFEDHNRTSSGDATRHPEFAIARWAAENLTPEQRQRAVVYTSGEHCPMCSAAHGMVGLGKIVYASSSQQLGNWLAAFGLSPGPVSALPIHTVVPGIEVLGPVEEFADELRAMQQQYRVTPS